MRDLNLEVGAGLRKLEGTRAEHDHFQYYRAQTGEHYALLRHLARQFEGTTIVDIGTHLGLSALALSDSSNRVLTLDIEDKRIVDLPQNVEFKLGNMANDKTLIPLNAALALLDIDPHAGEEERAIVQQLLDRGWKGVLLCDDIYLNEGMKAFWRWVCSQGGLETKDVTEVGHCTGTGLVWFNTGR